MECITIENGEISGNRTQDSLLDSGIEELFVVDLDSIRSGKLNLKLYDRLSKYFDIVVMNYPYRIADLIDTFVSGASRVVLNSNVSDSMIRESLSFSDQVVMKYARNVPCKTFSLFGGNMFLSNIEVDLVYTTIYAYGIRVQSRTSMVKRDSQIIILLNNFPEDSL
jgi:hypothetical protein